MRSCRRTIVALCALLAALGAAPGALAATLPSAKTLYDDGPSGRYLLDGDWYERPDPLDRGVTDGFNTNDDLAGWRALSVPTAVNARDFSVESYTGSVHWYRRDFDLPRARAGTRWIFRFESVNYRAMVWLNGKLLGSHVGAYLPFEIRATSIQRGVNHLVVRVDSRRSASDITPLSVTPAGNFEGGWWNYNGILREVYLRKVTSLDLQYAFVEPKLRCRRCAATVRINARVHNVVPRGRRARLVGSFGGRPLRFGAQHLGGFGSKHFKARLRIRNPRLWEPGHPHLYKLKLSLLDQNRRVVQRYTVHTGIRSLKVNRRGRIELNGRAVNLRGAAIHEDSLARGAALTANQTKQMFKNLRDLGATITRAHYPLSPYALELADRYGIVVWSEIPVYRMGSALFTSQAIRDAGLRMLRENIIRDYNHPSVMVWSIGNENASRPRRGLQLYIRRAAETAKRLDPTRLVGAAIAGLPTIAKQHIYKHLDVIGINDYFGWYTGPAGSISDRNALAAYLNRMHSYYPRQALLVTEVGAEANRHGPVTEKGTYEFQSDFLAYHLGVLASKTFINGAIIWALQDFRVKPGWTGGNPLPHPPVNEKGLVDDTGMRKPGFYAARAIFRATKPFR